METIAIQRISQFLLGLEKLGVEVATIPGATELGAAADRDPKLRVDRHLFMELIAEAERVTKDPLIALRSAHETGGRGFLSLLIQAQPTVGEALRTASRFIRTTAGPLRMRLEEGPVRSRLVIEHAPERVGASTRFAS